MSIKTKLMLFLVAILLASTAVSTTISMKLINDAVEADYHALSLASARTALATLSAIDSRMVSYADLMSRNPGLTSALATGDQGALERIVRREYENLHRNDASVKSLEVTNAAGVVVFRGHRPEQKGDDKSGTPQVKSALANKPTHGMTTSVTSNEIAQDAVVPIVDSGRVVGTLKVGSYLREETAQAIKSVSGTDVAFFVNGKKNATTTPITKEFTLPDDLKSRFDSTDVVSEIANIDGKLRNISYALLPGEGSKNAVLAIILPRDRLEAERYELLKALLTGAGLVLTVLIAAALAFARTLSAPLLSLRLAMKTLAAGDTNLQFSHHLRRDEIGAMAQAVLVFRDAAIENMRLAGAEANHRDGLDRERARNEQMQRDAIERERAIVTGSIGAALKRLAAKDLTYRMSTDIPEAYRRLQADFNEAVDELEAAMRSVTGSAVVIDSSAREISSASDDLSHRSERQAASLEETAAALDQITATVQKSAGNARQAHQVVAVADADAKQGAAVVREAVSAMEAISTSSSRIGQIIGVIEEIAFQTNLLALNAGVEAARAGEAGKGFAVVAMEVRGLAQRSADSAKEIKSLISDATSQVGAGVKLVVETGRTLERVNAHMSEITGVVAEMSTSAQEQATALLQVNTALHQMDQMTQQNATMVEQSTAASHSLARQSTQLARLVHQFTMSGRDEVRRRAA